MLSAKQARGWFGALLLVATLNAGLLQQLAVLLLRHALTALLDDRAHGATSRSRKIKNVSIRTDWSTLADQDWPDRS
jgi:hypothetical protein